MCLFSGRSSSNAQVFLALAENSVTAGDFHHPVNRNSPYKWFENTACYYNSLILSLAEKSFCAWIVYGCFLRFYYQLLWPLLDWITWIWVKIPIKIWIACTCTVPRLLGAMQEEKLFAIPYPQDQHLPFPFQHWDQFLVILQFLFFLHLTNKAPRKFIRNVSKHVLTRKTKSMLFYSYSGLSESDFYTL